MKKLIIIFSISVLFISCKKEVNINSKDFAIQDIHSINKIIMSDKTGNSVVLEKQGETWILNNKYKAWIYQIDYTLKVMKDIKIKSSVSEEVEEMVIKNLATSSVKIEIYMNNTPTKTYYIGGNTRDHLGTYMIMKESSTPFIMHIPDRQPGILNPKFGLEGNTVNEIVWREPITIAITPISSIKEIKVKDMINTEQSFSINMIDKELTNIDGIKIPIDKIHLNIFSSYFEKLECGRFKPNLKKSDFILSKKIYITHNNNTDSLIIYDKTNLQNTQKEFNPTVDNLYATWNNSDLVIIQKQIFNKVLITLDEFIQ